MTSLQDVQRAALAAFDEARRTLDADAYRAFLLTVEARLTRELARLVHGEALRTARGDEAP
jgi:hypothetical protein